MDQDYEITLQSWAHSLIELEENSVEHQPVVEELATTSALVATTPSYYRSKGFSSTIGINPLINAADPILTLITKIRRLSLPPNLIIFHQHVCHEIKAFENKVQTLGYRPPLILASRYLICALLDELITISLWPNLEFKKYSFLATFHKELSQEDHFFLILERSLQNPSEHVELLELIFLCLRLGYEGKYRDLERGHFELSSISDHLYQVITEYKEEFSRSLYISSDSLLTTHSRRKNFLAFLPPVWITSTTMAITLVTAFSFLYFQLSEIAAPIDKRLNSISNWVASAK